MRLKPAQRFFRRPSVGRILLLTASLFFCFISGANSVTAQTTDDHGNSLGDATNLPLGSSIAGRIDPGDDLDVFRLDLSGASGQTHFWVFTTGTLDTFGRLYDSNIVRLTFNDDTTFGGVIVETNFRFSWTLSPGIYYVAVYSADRTTTGDYTIHARTDDHGHYFDTATTLSLGSSVAGRIDPGFDRDVFKLDLSGASGTTDVWIYTTGDLNTRGWLYDSNVNLLAFNRVSYIAGREDSFSLRRNLPSGVYYISVRSYDGAVGDYTLHAEAVTGPGNTTGTATTLSLDSPTPGTVDRAGDADYFRLDITESMNLVVHANNPFLRFNAGSDDAIPIETLDVTMLDSQGAEISVNILSVFRGVSVKDDFEAGTYYVKVTAPADDTTYPVPYTIHAYEDTEYTKFIADCQAATATLNNPQISDPLYGCQWHLSNREQGGEDINVEAVWAEGINGQGVNIAVVDDGMDSTHEDLAANVNTTLNHNYDTGNYDVYYPYNHHGTAVAGVIAARDNGVGVRGVAPRATVYGYNFLTGDAVERERAAQDINRADAMGRNRVVTAVSNNSWGPSDGPWLSQANDFWKLAVDSGLREGYDGKGVLYVFAAGNGGSGHRLDSDGNPVGGHFDAVRRRGDDSNLSEIENYYAVTAVCAVNDGDTRSVYSEKGANLWVCAPSKDGWEQEYRDHRGIVTTENSDRYRDDFDGTSAAAPAVSGVAALLRQANPDLTWRDLKLILAASARKNDASNSGWADGARKYGAGSDADRYHFNHEYGFGMVDAKAAVDLARGWTNVPPLMNDSAANKSAVTVPDAPFSGVPQTVTTTLTLNTDIRFTEFVEINIDFNHRSFRDMDIELVSPSGAVSKLTVPFDTSHYYTDDLCINPIHGILPCTFLVRLDGEFRFGSARHLGEDPNGVWTLRLTDHFPIFGGTLRSWNIQVYGHVQDRPGSPLFPCTAGTVVPEAANNPGLVAECDMLMAARDTLAGSGTLNWSQGTPIADWDGVTVEGTPPRVVSLDLRERGLTGQIPATLGRLSSLTYLNLRSNQLTGTIPVQLGNLANLERLSLTRNELTGPIPVALSNLSNLSILALGGNDLTGIIPAELGSLTNLQELYLWGNQLTGTIPTQLGNLTSLQRLELSDNQLTGTIPAQLGNLANLELLNLTRNELTGPIPVALSNLSNLSILALGGNDLTGSIPAELGSLTNLQELYLWGNQLTGTIPTQLGSLTSLQRLGLSDNQLTGTIPAQLGSLSNLERLVLWGNQLTGPVPAELGNLSNLEVLSLSNNQLTGTIPAQLGRLTNLTELYLAGNQLTGCVPVGLRSVADNDFARLGLPFCTVAPPTGATATRSFSPATVAPGGRVTVTIAAANYGTAGGVTETLPAGFTYVSSSLSDNQVTITGQVVRFTLQGETSFTYTVTAPSVEGPYTFSGTLRDFERNDRAVGGAATVTVSSSGDPLVARYDANGNGRIEKSEVIKAINDYLFGTGDPITKEQVIRLINLYLFGPTTSSVARPPGTSMGTDGDGQRADATEDPEAADRTR